MQALKLTVTIPGSRRLEIDLPGDTPEGTAEVIILVTPSTSATPRPGSPEARSAAQTKTEEWRAANLDRLLPAQAILGYLAEERAGWGDEE